MGTQSPGVRIRSQGQSRMPVMRCRSRTGIRAGKHAERRGCAAAISKPVTLRDHSEYLTRYPLMRVTRQP